MSRILGVLNYKGGTGKTTTVVNLAAGLAIRGARVLCIDLDAQGSLATHLGVHYESSLTNLLLGQEEVSSCIVNARENLDLIASDINLHHAEGALWRMEDEMEARLVLGEKLSVIDDYDYIILDHSPSASILNESGLLYAQQIIVPVSMDYFALIGTRQVLQMLGSIRQISDRDIRISMIVPTFYFDRLRKDREIMAILRNRFNGKVANPIRANVSLSEAPSHQMSIYEYAPRSAGSIDYASLVERIVKHG